MLQRFKDIFVIDQKTIKSIFKYIVIPALAFIAMTAYADDTGKDLLEGTGNDLIKTIKTSGKLYIYLAEFVVCGVSFVKTRNPLVFVGIVILAIGFNIIFKIAGVG